MTDLSEAIDEPDVTGAVAAPANRFEKILNAVPRLLSSKGHIVFLFALGLYLVVLPVLHIYTPGPTQMLEGGNYTNVTSDLGACIAAGGTVHLIKKNREHRNELAKLHAKLDHVIAHQRATGQ